jgi:peptidoglycan/xylan/chitin deacetylase (PgdA/CDA1 family)
VLFRSHRYAQVIPASQNNLIDFLSVCRSKLQLQLQLIFGIFKMRKIIFNILVDLGLSIGLRYLRVRNTEITVLMFHRVSNDYDTLWPPIPINTFEKLIKLLSKKTHIIPIEKIDILNSYLAKPIVIISFDDGYEDFYYNALPILLKYNVPAHLNICPGLIENNILPWTQIVNHYIQNNPITNLLLPNGQTVIIPAKATESFFNNICYVLYSTNENSRDEFISYLQKNMDNIQTNLLSWGKLEECAKHNIHIGSHSMNHLNLAKINDTDKLNYEIVESKKRIKEKTGKTPLVFAFPNGLYNQESLKIAVENYKYILLCDDMTSVFQANKHFYIFPRINIAQNNYKEEYLRSLGFHQLLKKIVTKKAYLFDSDTIFSQKQ